MLKKDSDAKYPEMNPEQRRQFSKAIAEEEQGKAENIAAARDVLPRLLASARSSAAIVQQLREAREAAGVSLAEMETRTGIRKSALSRLENSKAPNPTLSTLRRYAEAIGKKVVFLVVEDDS